MSRRHFAHHILGRWIVVATLLFTLAGATVLSVAAQASEGSPVATIADPATDDAVMTDTEQAQATDAAADVVPAPTPTVVPVQFGPTGC